MTQDISNIDPILLEAGLVAQLGIQLSLGLPLNLDQYSDVVAKKAFNHAFNDNGAPVVPWFTRLRIATNRGAREVTPERTARQKGDGSGPFYKLDELTPGLCEWIGLLTSPNGTPFSGVHVTLLDEPHIRYIALDSLPN